MDTPGCMSFQSVPSIHIPNFHAQTFLTKSPFQILSPGPDRPEELLPTGTHQPLSSALSGLRTYREVVTRYENHFRFGQSSVFAADRKGGTRVIRGAARILFADCCVYGARRRVDWQYSRFYSGSVLFEISILSNSSLTTHNKNAAMISYISIYIQIILTFFSLLNFSIENIRLDKIAIHFFLIIDCD